MGNELPFAACQFRVDLADTSFPEKLAASVFVTPEGMDIDNSESPIPFLRDLDPGSDTFVTNKIIVIEERLPALASSFPIEPSQLKDPIRRIVIINRGRPGPDHVRMNDGKEKVRVLHVPTGCFQVDERLNVSLHIIY